MSTASTFDLVRLVEFIRESNLIEGITRDPVEQELEAHIDFLALKTLTVDDFVALVQALQPSVVLRDRVGRNVRVGNHTPPPGGPEIKAQLESLLDAVGKEALTAHQAHHLYETLHPFTDGNGRTGRALWLWMHRRNSPDRYKRAMAIGFLHSWYYESLENARG